MGTTMRLFSKLFCVIFVAVILILLGNANAETEVKQLWHAKLDSSVVVFEGGLFKDNIVIHTTSGFQAFTEAGEKEWTYNYPAGSYTLGLPVIEENIALFVVYTGKDAKGGGSSDALLNALDLNSGNLLWSAYLPQYLPLDYRIIDSKLYVSCQYISKPLKKKNVIKRWVSSPESRRDTWLMCIDVNNGRQRWYQQVSGWISAIGKNENTVYFQEYGSSIEGSYTVITSRNESDGSLIWTSERFREELTFVESFKQIDGEIFISDKNLVLLDRANGSTLRKIDIGVGSYTVKNGLFWNLTYKAEKGFFLQKINLKDLAEIQEEKIHDDFREFGTWTGKKAFSNSMQENLAYWYKHQAESDNSKLSYFIRDKKKSNEVLYLPIPMQNQSLSNSMFLDSYFFLNLFNGVETLQAVYTFEDQPEMKIMYSGGANQQPESIYIRDGNSLLTVFDNLLLQLDDTGNMNVLVDNLSSSVMDIFRIENDVYVIDDGGIWAFNLSEKKIEIVKEPVIEPEPEISEPVALIPIPEPEPEIVTPEAPQYREVEKEVDGWRIQIMYLTQTTIEKAESYAKESEKKIGFPVYVVSDNAVKLRAGNFETETAARQALTQVKNSGYKDAYLVKCKVFIKEKIQIN